MSDDEVWEAVKALLLTAPGFKGQHVYDDDEVPGSNGNPGTLPPAFAVLSVERRYVPPNRQGGTARVGYRAAVRHVGTTATNARRVGKWVQDALESSPGRGKKITVGGVKSTAITHESTNAVAKDGTEHSGLSQWTLAL
ncbi:MAG TPA: hypothetical protein VGE38_16665 [Nocardioides sp.]|uniref:hypothetical protein n=1 Tax=Nocardioides sp. TaxID=35761 RepID=UPI002EDA2B8F